MSNEISEGLGDALQKITEATGIAPAVRVIEQLTGRKCNCDKRRKALNKRFPSRRKQP